MLLNCHLGKMMRRRVTHLCVVAALALSGWGGAVAAAVCAHARAGAHDAHCHAARRADTDAPRRGHASHAKPHRQPEADPSGDHCRHAQRASTSSAPVASALAQGGGAPRGRRAPCTHCFASPGGATSTAAVTEQSRRGKLQQAAPPARSQSAAFDVSHAPRVTPKQGAPPGPASRRHLVLSVFLI